MKVTLLLVLCTFMFAGVALAEGDDGARAGDPVDFTPAKTYPPVNVTCGLNQYAAYLNNAWVCLEFPVNNGLNGGGG
jgi:hypothetical protein